MKTGTLSKTKIFATVLKDDSSFYVIDQKLVPRDANGQIEDRIDPTIGPGWQRFKLEKCQVLPSNSDKKCFKFLINRDEENKAEKEQRFFAANICSRTVWVKKLLQAKNRSFEAGDCDGVPIE